MSGFRIRKAEGRDLEGLLALHLALQDHLEGAGPDLWRMTPEGRQQLRGQLAARLAAPDVCVLVAEQEAMPLAGTVSGRIVTNARYLPTRAGVIDQLYVVPGQRRQGIGSGLVAELRRFFVEQGVTDISLRTMAGNEEAEAFWAALGFAPRIVILGMRVGGFGQD